MYNTEWTRGSLRSHRVQRNWGSTTGKNLYFRFQYFLSIEFFGGVHRGGPYRRSMDRSVRWSADPVRWTGPRTGGQCFRVTPYSTCITLVSFKFTSSLYKYRSISNTPSYSQSGKSIESDFSAISPQNMAKNTGYKSTTQTCVLESPSCFFWHHFHQCTLEQQDAHRLADRY